MIIHIEQEHQLRQLANRAPLEIGEFVETFHGVHLITGCHDTNLPAYAPHRKHRHTPSAFIANGF